jgi:hypothetical protein
MLQKELFALAIESKNEGIDLHKRWTTWNLVQRFLARQKEAPNFRGYAALLGANDKPIQHEGFEFGWENDDIDGPMSGAKVWPPKSEAPNFREVVLKY